MKINEEANMKDKGIYIIINHESGAVYVGSTSKSFRDRLSSHLYQLKRNNHHNPHLQLAWNKYPAFVFEFTVLEYVNDIKLLDAREKYWIDYHRMFTDIYNIELVPGQCRAFKQYKPGPRLRRSEQSRAMRRGERWVKVGKQSPAFQHGFSLGDIHPSEVSYWEALEIEYQRWMDGDLYY